MHSTLQMFHEQEVFVLVPAMPKTLDHSCCQEPPIRIARITVLGSHHIGHKHRDWGLVYFDVLELKCPARWKMRCLVGLECEAYICPLLAKVGVVRIELLHNRWVRAVRLDLSIVDHFHEPNVKVRKTSLETDAFTTCRLRTRRTEIPAVRWH